MKFTEIHQRLKSSVGKQVPTSASFRDASLVKILEVTDIERQTWPTGNGMLSAFVKALGGDKTKQLKDSTFNYSSDEYIPVWKFSVKYGWKRGKNDYTEKFTFAIPATTTLQSDDVVYLDESFPLLLNEPATSE